MKIKFGKEKIIPVLEVYFREVYDFDGKVSFSISKGTSGYGMGEWDDCILSMKIKGSMEVLGEVVETECDISLKELENAFCYSLEKEGHTFKGMVLDKGLHRKCEDYGIWEHTIKTPYFHGVEVFIEDKVKKFGGK